MVISDESPHRVHWFYLYVALVLVAAPNIANAQSQPTTEQRDNSYGLYNNFDPSMAIIVVVLICAFFFVGLFAIYIRHCAESGEATLALGRPASNFGAGSRRARGVDPTVLEKFPVFLYSSVKDHKMGKDALECAVCLSEFQDDETLRLLPKCSHVFHPDCIGAWLASHVTCPVCRAKLTPESGELTKNSPEPNSELNCESRHENSRPELRNEESNQIIVINVNEDQNREEQARVISNTDELVATAISRRFPRSHSTGHSLVQPGENMERYTLRLPEEIRRQIATPANGRLKRTMSYGVIFPREGSSRKGYRSGGEGSSRGKNYTERWIFSMTPPFVSRTGSVRCQRLLVEAATAMSPLRRGEWPPLEGR